MVPEFPSQEILEKAVHLLKRGYGRNTIRRKLGIDKLTLEIALARLKAGDKFSRKNLWMDLSGLRYATHEIVAQTRAQRLKEVGVGSLADVSCGVGVQLIFYAMNVEKAYGIDIDPLKVEFARRNAKIYGVDNIEFLVGNSLSMEIAGRIKADVVYSDPARPPVSRKRTLEELQPNLRILYDLYHPKVSAFIFDLPPQIRRELIPWKGEFEYVDLYGHLNRLTFYTDELAMAERSALILPSMIRLKNDDSLENIVSVTGKIGEYLYEVPQAVVYADLLNELLHRVKGEMEFLIISKRRTIATGNEKLISPYLKRTYRVIDVLRFHPARINEALKREGFGRATLKFPLSPSEHTRIKKIIERGLTGKKRAFVFKFGENGVIAEAIV